MSISQQCFFQNTYTPSPAPEINKHRTPVDRGYPPQHTAESEKEYLRRRREAMEEHRDRRSVPPSYSTPPENYDRYELRRRDDPKQVSNQ